MSGVKVIRHYKTENPNKLSKETENLIKEKERRFNKKQQEINLKLIKSQQDKVISSLNKPYNKTLRLKSMKLPINYRDIDNDSLLSEVLLKNPEFMSIEERQFVESFNEKETEVFFEYLKMKSKERNWIGNGLGSGFYLNNYIYFYRNKEKYKKPLTFKDYLNQINENKKKTIDNVNANNILKNENESMSFNSNFQNDNEEDTKKRRRLEKLRELALNKFNEEANELKKEMEDMRITMLKEKNNLIMEKATNDKEKMNFILNEKLEEIKKGKDNFLQNNNKNTEKDNDSESMSETNNMINQYNINLKNNKKIIIFKEKLFSQIKLYLTNHSMTTYELIKLIDMDYSKKEKIKIIDIEKKLSSLAITSKEEAEYFKKCLKENFGEEINIEVFNKLLEVVMKVSNNQNKDNDDNDNEELIEIIKEYNNRKKAVKSISKLDEKGNKRKLSHNEYKTIMKDDVISSRNLKELNYIVKYKLATIINSNIKGYLIRKKISHIRKIRITSINKIITKFKEHFLKRMKIKHISAMKIQMLMRKNFKKSKKYATLEKLTSKWISNNQPIQNICAIKIQRYWKIYKNRQLNEIKNSKVKKLDEGLLSNKLCYICGNNKVFFFCVDCGGIHYCEIDFMKYHNKGYMKNHDYLTVEENTKKIKPGMNFDIKRLREYIKLNKIILYDHLKMWDFKKNSLIKVKHLKDALSVKFFNFKKEYCNILLSFSYQFLNENRDLSNINDCYFNYEEMCFNLIY